MEPEQYVLAMTGRQQGLAGPKCINSAFWPHCVLCTSNSCSCLVTLWHTWLQLALKPHQTNPFFVTTIVVHKVLPFAQALFGACASSLPGTGPPQEPLLLKTGNNWPTGLQEPCELDVQTIIAVNFVAAAPTRVPRLPKEEEGMGHGRSFSSFFKTGF